MDFIVEIPSQNLVTTSNFVEFRDSGNFMFFEGDKGHLAHCEWLEMSHVSSCE